MKFLIITSCTGKKAVDHPDQLTLVDFKAGERHLTRRENELKAICRRAADIYTGEQHLRLMRGLASLRDANSGRLQIQTQLHILSAGYGLIPEGRSVAPYEVSFATMKPKELRDWSNELRIPEDFRRTVAAKYDLGLILLGDKYLRACALEGNLMFGGPTLLICGNGAAKRLPPLKNVRVLPISNPEAKRFSCSLVGLKGELAARLLRGLAGGPEALERIIDPRFDLLGWLENIRATKVVAKGCPGT